MGRILVTKNPRKAGFSLLELSIVITIVGILLYSTIAVGLSQVEVARVKATQDKLDKINNAIIVFFKTNGYLPCPAQPAGTGANLGLESRSGTAINTASANGTTCNATGVWQSTGTYPSVYVGVIPTKTLNLPDDYSYDTWGNRITFVVSRYCVSGLNWGTSYSLATAYPSANTYACTDGSATTTNGNSITIKDGAGNTISGSAAFAIISHGKNGKGSWSKLTGTKNTVDPADVAERGNGNFNTGTGVNLTSTTANVSYYDAPYNDGTIAANYFDDIIRWKSAAQAHFDANH